MCIPNIFAFSFTQAILLDCIYIEHFRLDDGDVIGLDRKGKCADRTVKQQLKNVMKMPENKKKHRLAV